MTRSVDRASPLGLGRLVVPNRLAKAAMTEGLADGWNRPTAAHERLYRRWAEGGSGLLITGNMLLDRRHLERAGNIALDAERPGTIERLARLAAAAKSGGAVLLAQLSHAGRQTPRSINPAPEAASAVPLALPGGQFGAPVEMSEARIHLMLERFESAAAMLARSGFDGAQVHAAHGYLLSGFLSPLANRRTDRWGGDLAGRARFLLEAVRAVRRGGGPDFLVSVKLNSADFQRGGFALKESVEVAQLLEAEGIDLLELSGGNYEQPSMMGAGARASTLAREAYFLEEAERLARAVATPLMLTGGFRTAAAMDRALGEGAIHLAGLARPLVVDPLGARRLLDDPDARLALPGKLLRVPKLLRGLGLGRALHGAAVQAWYYMQIVRLGSGREPDPGLGLLPALVQHLRRESAMAKALLSD